MIEPRRPDPVLSWQDKLRSRIERIRERVRDRSADVSLETPVELSTGPPLFLTVMLAVGSALLALGGLWAWQSWSQRSSEPIDDLLPRLVTAQADPTVSDPAATAAPADGVEPTITTAPVEISPIETIDELAEIVVHVSGAVADPGVVTLTSGARVFEAVDHAGGATSDADLERVNLAATVNDGEHVHVPVVGEEIPTELSPTASSSSTAEDPTPDRLIDINAGTASDLELLPGVGPAIAQAIVQTRRDRGPFLSIEELLDVPGIGEAKLAVLVPYIVVGG